MMGCGGGGRKGRRILGFEAGREVAAVVVVGVAAEGAVGAEDELLLLRGEAG